ncbi:MAG: signal peptidase I [Clostridia bacterium]|nr:signal peptidase I [Clostridia bacterium]
MENKEIQKSVGKSIPREIAEWVLCILAAFVVAIIIKYFIFTPTLVQQRSMTPTILDGERVLINRIVRTFQLPINRGDIITFEKPDATEESGVAYYNKNTGVVSFVLHDLLEITKVSYIKRVIGLGGDHIEISADGEVYINGEILNEPYLIEGLATPITGEFYNIDVPEGYIFVMGDNRTGSSDSREFGCIPLEKVEGRVTYRIWPLSKFGKIDK